MRQRKDMTIVDFLKDRMDDFFDYGEDGLGEYEDPLCKEVAEKLSPYLVGYVVRYLEKNAGSYWKTPENEDAIQRLSEMIENAYATYREKELDEAYREIEKIKLLMKDKDGTIKSINNARDALFKENRDLQSEIKQLNEKLQQAQKLVRKHDIISLDDLYQGKAFQ